MTRENYNLYQAKPIRMEKTKKEWVELFKRWVDLAMALEESGCMKGYSFSIYSGDGEYVSLNFKYDGDSVEKSFGHEVTQEDIDILETTLKVAKEETKESIKEKMQKCVESADNIKKAYDDYATMLESLDKE